MLDHAVFFCTILNGQSMIFHSFIREEALNSSRAFAGISPSLGESA
jgi:hypothetical protein